jgi:hypothetical protein
MPIEHIIVVAGPTAAGKSTLIHEMLAGRLPELAEGIGAADLTRWAARNMHSAEPFIETATECMIIEYDFLWHDFAGADIGHSRLASLLERAKDVSFITVWTPPARLEKQFLYGRLGAPLPPNLGGIFRGWVFRSLPRSVIRGVSWLPVWKKLDSMLPGTALLRGLVVERIYSRPGKLAAVYSRWFRLADEYESKTRGHLIVEHAAGRKIYSRFEWDKHVRDQA